MRSFKAISVISILFCLLPANSYSSGIKVSKVPVVEQMHSNSVQRLMQDSEGYMWFGTLDGLYRYDGYRIIGFRSDFNDPGLLRDNEITALAEDSRGNIWIGTKKGVNILDRSTYRITSLDFELLDGQEIKCLYVAGDNTVWVGGRNSIYRFSVDHKPVATYVNDPEDPGSFPNAGINSIYEDHNGDIWVTLWNSGLVRFDEDTGDFLHYPPVGRQNNPFKIFQDPDKHYWIFTWGDGIYSFNPTGNPENMYVRQDFYEESSFYSVVQDEHNGYIWAMGLSGIYAFSKTGPRSLSEVHVSDLFVGTNNIFSEMTRDRDGNLWIGAFSEGALLVSFDNPDVEYFAVGNIKGRTGAISNVTRICEDAARHIYMNLNRIGLGVYDPAADQVGLYSDYPGLRGIMGLNHVAAIVQLSGDRDIWVGLEEDSKIMMLRRRGEDMVVGREVNLGYIYDGCGNVRQMYVDSKNNLWVASQNSLFLKPYNSDDILLVTNRISDPTAITEDTKGSVWISSGKNGLFHIPYNYTMSFADVRIRNYRKGDNGLSSDNIQSACADSEGRVWVGTTEGSMLSYDIRTDVFSDMTAGMGLSGEVILGILTDHLGHIWFSTNKMVTEYSPRNGAFVQYSAGTELGVNSLLRGSCFRNRATGSIYFGGNMGLCRFTPSERLYAPAHELKPVITDVKVGNHSLLGYGGDTKLDLNSGIARLNPNDRNIEIDFSSLCYAPSSQVRYAYRLDGVDEDWVYAADNRQFASYSQLKKGTYNFHVKASDRNNLWTDSVTTLQIIKRPAFYESWMAVVIYVLIGLALIYIIIRVAINRLRLRNELSIAQIEKDKSEELAQTKLRYFTNISHEFLTPLTIISTLVDDMENTPGDKQAQYESIRQNAKKLKRLLQQVLDFRKAESGNLRLRISQGDIVTFIKDICYTNCLPLAKKKSIDFKFSADPASMEVFFDADKIEKIVFNLLSNAIKYTPKSGSVAVEVNGFPREGKDWVRIVVKDTGVGIPEDVIPKIFTRFFTSETRNAAESNGIGLSLTKDLAELHKGSVSVESKVGEGSVFMVELPVDRECFVEADVELLRSEDADTQMVVANSASADVRIPDDAHDIAAGGEVFEKKKNTVLVVEDNEELLAIIGNYLSKSYNVLLAPDGKAALELVRNNEVDIVVSDVMMPVMDGMELARALKDNIETSHISIILLTARNTPDTRIECYNAGADGYISKPFEIKVLEARINNFLSARRKRQKDFKTNVEINISALDYPSRDEGFLQEAIHIIEQNLSEADFDVNSFAHSLHMSKSSLYRKIKTMTGLSPIEFIRNIRLKHAYQMLRDSDMLISEVAYYVGFSDPKYFTSCFKNEFKFTPSEYQRMVTDKES